MALVNPFLRGWYQADDSQRQNTLAQGQELAGAVNMQAGLAKLQIEQQARQELASAKTPEEQQAVAIKYAGPQGILTHFDTQARVKATNELALQRLQQQSQHQQVMEGLARQAGNRAEATTAYNLPGYQPNPAAPAPVESPGARWDALSRDASAVRNPQLALDQFNVLRGEQSGGAGMIPTQNVVAGSTPPPLVQTAPPVSAPSAPPAIPGMPTFTGSPREIAMAQNKWRLEQMKQGAANTAQGDFTKKGDEFLSSLPEADRQLVKKIANYDIDPKTLSTRGGHREKMLSLVSQFDPTYDDTQYANKRRAIAQFGSGPQGNTVRSLNVAIEHIDTLQRAADALKNGDFTPGNKIYNEAVSLFGQVPPNKFEAIRDIVANEVIKGTIGNSGALEDRRAAAEKVRASSSPQQLKALMDGWTELMGGQVKGLERQYESATRNKDFRERYLTQRSREAIGLAESKVGQSGGQQPAATGSPAQMPTFATEAEAAAAGLTPGTKVKIGNQTGVWK